MRLPQRFAEEPLRRLRIPLGREQEVDGLAAAVDRPIQVGPAALHLDVGLIHAPCVREVVRRLEMISHFQRAGRRDELAYSTERRAAVLTKLEPPNAVPLRQLAKDEGIS